MSEIVTSVFNKNSFLYGAEDIEMKNFGPSCVDMRGEEINETPDKPQVAHIKAVCEK